MQHSPAGLRYKRKKQVYETLFSEVIEDKLSHEGGYVFDPDDLGGETNWGISKRQYPDLDIKSLTREDAIDIYYKDYWLKGKCRELPNAISPLYFDMCVNFGRSGATKVLQEACNSQERWKTEKKLEVDGRIGPKTIQAAQGVSKDRVKAYRLLRFAKIVAKRPKQEKYWYGWYKRSIDG